MVKVKKVSIVTPCYNGEKFIDRYMKMILEQTYSHLELVFINDGSTDQTEKIVKSYEVRLKEKNIDFVYCYQKNAGQAAAINKGLQMFTGDYFVYPDADDILLPDSIQKRAEFLDNHTEYGFVGSKGWDAYEDDLDHYVLVAPRQNGVVENLFMETIKNEWTTFTCTYMFRRDAFFKSLPSRKIYMNSDFTLQDVQMLLPIAYHYKCGFLEDYLYVRVIRSDSHSQRREPYSKLLIRNDAIEDVYMQTIKEISMPIKERDVYIELVKCWFLRLRKYILLNYALEKEVCSLYSLLKNKCNGRDLVVFGTGEDAMKLMTILPQQEYPCYFIDNNVDQQGKLFWGLTVKSLNLMKQEKSKFFILVVTSQYGIQIKKQLLQEGFTYCKDFVLFEDIL
ncbi:glycosyltransferase family 2 protein [Propionispira arboris]|uniref:glycosyltransferase family 2 protein n=1 Tax=Propionispira arboris TaxID=84035 RepID=UPI0015A63A54|nr:glycosyltransferase family 2 protein [Propionispira arboris]